MEGRLFFAYDLDISAREWGRWRRQQGLPQHLLRREGRALLPDHALKFRTSTGPDPQVHLDLIEHRGSVVEGALFEVTPEGWDALDRRRCLHALRQRIETTALLVDGRTVDVVTDVLRPELRGTPERPTETHRHALSRAREHHGISTEALERAAAGLEPEQATEVVFVYGTLLRGEQRHDQVMDHLRRVLPAAIPGRLQDYGEYPSLLPATGGEQEVQGELLFLDDIEQVLPLLDAVEGFFGYDRPGSLFRRVLISTPAAGREGLAWAWVAGEALGTGEPIAGGSWRTRALARAGETDEHAFVDGLFQVRRELDWPQGGPDSALYVGPEQPPVVTWKGADLMVSIAPIQPPDEDWSGYFARHLKVVSPYAPALGWLITRLMERVLYQGLPLDKYTFFERLGRAALYRQAVSPHHGEEELLDVVWCEAERMVQEALDDGREPSRHEGASCSPADVLALLG